MDSYPASGEAKFVLTATATAVSAEPRDYFTRGQWTVTSWETVNPRPPSFGLGIVAVLRHATHSDRLVTIWLRQDCSLGHVALLSVDGSPVSIRELSHGRTRTGDPLRLGEAEQTVVALMQAVAVRRPKRDAERASDIAEAQRALDRLGPDSPARAGIARYLAGLKRGTGSGRDAIPPRDVDERHERGRPRRLQADVLRVAEVYVGECQKRGEKGDGGPTGRTAARLQLEGWSVVPKTVSGYVQAARSPEYGLLTTTRQGACGGSLTPKAHALLAQRHEPGPRA